MSVWVCVCVFGSPRESVRVTRLGLHQWPPTFFVWLPPSVTGPPKFPPPHTKLPIQINIPYNLNNIYVVIRNNNSVKLYDDFKEQRKIMGFSEMVVPAS